MISILSSSQQIPKNNTMTLIKGGGHHKAGLSSLGPNTTIYGEESLVENGEIEELHYLMVKVEKMKKQMLCKVEGRAELKSALDKHPTSKTQLGTAPLLDENDIKEELLYRSTDNLIEAHTGGGDIISSSNAVATTEDRRTMGYSNIQINQTGRNSELAMQTSSAMGDGALPT